MVFAPQFVRLEQLKFYRVRATTASGMGKTLDAFKIPIPITTALRNQFCVAMGLYLVLGLF